MLHVTCISASVHSKQCKEAVDPVTIARILIIIIIIVNVVYHYHLLLLSGPVKLGLYQ